jgi:hypothetical protein
MTADISNKSAFNRAVQNMAYVFGRPGRAALQMFLDQLPSDATINWGEGFWVPVAVVAEQLRAELKNDRV